MWPFSNDDASTEEPNECDSDEQAEERVAVERTGEREYTEHTALAQFVDGSEREFVFDSMNDDGSKIVLKNYTDIILESRNLIDHMVSHHEFVGEAFVTIPHDNLKTFETLNRETKSMEYTYPEYVPASEVDE